MVFFFNFFSTLQCRYSLRGGDNGKLQHNPRSSLGLFNDITAMLTWMLRSKMQLTCMCHGHVFLNCLLSPSNIFFPWLDSKLVLLLHLACLMWNLSAYNTQFSINSPLPNSQLGNVEKKNVRVERKSLSMGCTWCIPNK